MLVKPIDVFLCDTVATFNALNRVEENHISVDKAMVFLHYALILLPQSELKESTLAVACATQASGLLVFFLRFSEGAVIEAKLFTTFDVFLRKHTYTVHLI